MFIAGYKDFLDHFEEIWKTENDHKINNLIKYITSLINKNKL